MKLKVLVIEDSPTAVEVITEGIRGLPCPSDIEVIEKGDEAILYFERLIKDSSAELPDLVVLDLELPGVHGLDILKKAKSDPKLKDITFIVNTGSSKLEYVMGVKKVGNVQIIRKAINHSEAVKEAIFRAKPELKHL